MLPCVKHPTLQSNGICNSRNQFWRTMRNCLKMLWVKTINLKVDRGSWFMTQQRPIIGSYGRYWKIIDHSHNGYGMVWYGMVIYDIPIMRNSIACMIHRAISLAQFLSHSKAKWLVSWTRHWKKVQDTESHLVDNLFSLSSIHVGRCYAHFFDIHTR